MTFKTRIIGIISVWFLCACYLQHTPGLEQVIAKVTDQKVKSALLQFEEGGIEKSINSKENLSADNLITSAKYFLNTPHCMGGHQADHRHKHEYIGERHDNSTSKR